MAWAHNSLVTWPWWWLVHAVVSAHYGLGVRQPRLTAAWAHGDLDAWQSGRMATSVSDSKLVPCGSNVLGCYLVDHAFFFTSRSHILVHKHVLCVCSPWTLY